MSNETQFVEYGCIVCHKALSNYDPQMCCNGFDCGCMGQPTNPPVCSEECWGALMNRNANADPECVEELPF